MNLLRAQSSPAATWIGCSVIIGLLASGCASGQPLPTQPVTDIEAASRSAKELGAANNPQAQLHLKLADEQLQQAKAAAEDNDQRAAERLLQRAKADAELALALTRGSNTQVKANEAISESDAAQSETAGGSHE
jgi:5'-3' exonuclease